MIRTSLVILGGVGLAFLAFVEIVLAYPNSAWLYLLAIAVLAAGLIRRVPIRAQRARLVVVGIALTAVAVLYSVEWSTRKPFLRDLARVRPGMTTTEVRRIMGRYLEGTGWSLPPVDTVSPSAGGLAVADEGSEDAPRASRGGELALPKSLVFRHSNAARYNSDWGIIAFSGGRVVGVSFSAD